MPAHDAVERAFRPALRHVGRKSSTARAPYHSGDAHRGRVAEPRCGLIEAPELVHGFDEGRRRRSSLVQEFGKPSHAMTPTGPLTNDARNHLAVELQVVA